jgi:membrane protease YdiL (CAAX protease family)
MRAATSRALAGHPVAAFLLIGNGAMLAAAAGRPRGDDILPFDLPLLGAIGGILGVALAAFLVTGATAGRAGLVDLLRRTFRWRVPLRWYLLALLGVPVAATLLAAAIYGGEALTSPPEGWPKAVAAVVALFALQLVLFQLAEEIGWTGFLQNRWRDRYSPLRLSAYVAFLWAVWHVPDFFADEGWGLEQLAVAPVFLAVEFAALFFARVLIVGLYNRTGMSVLLVAIFHASFDASISELSYDVVPGSNTARFVLFTAVIVVAATATIILTRGRVGDDGMQRSRFESTRGRAIPQPARSPLGAERNLP